MARRAEGKNDLADLDAELRRLTQRAGRQKAVLGREDRADPKAWQRWSASLDEGLALVARIESLPIRDLAGLAVRFRALMWRIRIDEGVILDAEIARGLEQFGRALTRIARS